MDLHAHIPGHILKQSGTQHTHHTFSIIEHTETGPHTHSLTQCTAATHCTMRFTKQARPGESNSVTQSLACSSSTLQTYQQHCCYGSRSLSVATSDTLASTTKHNRLKQGTNRRAAWPTVSQTPHDPHPPSNVTPRHPSAV